MSSPITSHDPEALQTDATSSIDAISYSLSETSLDPKPVSESSSSVGSMSPSVLASTDSKSSQEKEKPQASQLISAIEAQSKEDILSWMNKAVQVNMMKDLRTILAENLFVGPTDPLSFCIQLAVFLKSTGARYVFSKTLVEAMQDNQTRIEEITKLHAGQKEFAPFQELAINCLKDMETDVVNFVLQEYGLKSKMTTQQAIDYARALITSHKTKEAATFVVHFNLQEQFSSADILEPLVAARRFEAAEKFVKSIRPLETKLIELISKHPEGGPKAAHKYIKKFGHDISQYPDLHQRLMFGIIRWIISSEKEEILDHFLKENPPYVAEALNQILIRKHYSWALSIVNNHGATGHFGPARLTRQELEKLAAEDESPLGKDTLSDIGKEGYLQFDESRVNVIMVDNANSLAIAEEALLQDGAIIGLDAEWKATFYDNEDHNAALLQASLENTVFLFDLTYFATPCLPLISAILENEKILKLGFAFSHDMTQLKRSFRDTRYLKDLNNYIDIAEMYYYTKNPNKARTKGSLTGISLANVVQDVLKVKLSKKQQCSNWERRPLTKDQIHYASLDARCLLDCYAILQDWTISLPTAEPGSVGNDSPSSIPRSAKKDNVILSNEEVAEGVLSALRIRGKDQVRFLVDSSMGRLMRQLRVLGIDTESTRNAIPGLGPFVPERQFERELVIMAAKEERVLLTRNQRLSESRHLSTHGFNEGLFVRDRVPCIVLQSNSSQEQLRQVLELFRIKITKEKLLSRCSKCNGDQFLELGKEDVRDRVPENIANVVDEFWECGKCHQVYWVGPQYSNTMDWWTAMASDLGDADGSNTEDDMKTPQKSIISSPNAGFYHSKIHYDESGNETSEA
eukprot:TRINITY_DN8305_c0_g1_i1.p1 TRINITY_DN8305_c0_g1~~TRINITY_DN8305_c0_g1_i1.p1  ORF type:complete len:859 (+),score=146.58 TRINITY_DN8305_c0_g1_i1:56-2632(+)